MASKVVKVVSYLCFSGELSTFCACNRNFYDPENDFPELISKPYAISVYKCGAGTSDV